MLECENHGAGWQRARATVCHLSPWEQQGGLKASAGHDSILLPLHLSHPCKHKKTVCALGCVCARFCLRIWLVHLAVLCCSHCIESVYCERTYLEGWSLLLWAVGERKGCVRLCLCVCNGEKVKVCIFIGHPYKASIHYIHYGYYTQTAELTQPLLSIQWQ